MSIIGKTTKLAYFFTHAIDLGRPSLRALDIKINNFSTTNKDKIMKKPSILSLEEFKKQKFQSLDSYIEEKKSEYPNVSVEELKERHHNICSSMYRRYQRIQENPSNNPALILQSDFFEDESKSVSGK